MKSIDPWGQQLAKLVRSVIQKKMKYDHVLANKLIFQVTNEIIAMDENQTNKSADKWDLAKVEEINRKQVELSSRR